MISNEHTYIPQLHELVSEIPPDSIVSRTIFEDDQQKVVLFGFAAGESLSEHTASSPAVLYFVSGEGSLTLGKDTFQAIEGTWVHMAANLPHSVYAKTEFLMLLTLIKS